MLKTFIYIVFVLILNANTIINENNEGGKILFSYAPNTISHLRSMTPFINKLNIYFC